MSTIKLRYLRGTGDHNRNDPYIDGQDKFLRQKLCCDSQVAIVYAYYDSHSLLIGHPRFNSSQEHLSDYYIWMLRISE